jgi:hypothetical protein
MAIEDIVPTFDSHPLPRVASEVAQMFTVRESVADYRYAAALVAIALRMSATNSR